MNDDKPTKITHKDIDDFVQKLMTYEIPEKTCFSCGKSFYFDCYGEVFGECDECYFNRWPEEERKAFFRSFLE